MLGRFQISSVPVLNFWANSVPVLIGSNKCIAFGSGYEGFGSTVFTVLKFGLK